jgi:osmotically-inducible protein OsmY
MDNRYRSSNGQQDYRDRYASRGRQDEQFSAESDHQQGEPGWRTQENERWQSGVDYDRGHGRNEPRGGGNWARPTSGFGQDTSSLDDYDRSFAGSTFGQPDRQTRSYGSTGYGDYSQSRNTTTYGSDRYGSGSYRTDGPAYSRQGGIIPPRQYDRDDRGFFDRASDEVMSWFGDDDAARRRQLDAREDHRGKGPSGYTRSKERLLEDANERLMHDRSLDASNITVTCDDNEITLTGTVDSRHAKRRAEDIVDNISGVKHVQNNLRVQTSGTSYYSETSTLTES